MTFDEIITQAINPAMALLPPKMDTVDARVLVLATAAQESELIYRRQKGNGPARSFWQMERSGGVAGVMKHKASADLMRMLCDVRKVAFTPMDVWKAIEFDDVLAAGAARLLYWTDAGKLPTASDVKGAWDVYARTWRPGKPHPEKWPANHRAARAALGLP